MCWRRAQVESVGVLLALLLLISGLSIASQKFVRKSNLLYDVYLDYASFKLFSFYSVGYEDYIEKGISAYLIVNVTAETCYNKNQHFIPVIKGVVTYPTIIYSLPNKITPKFITCDPSIGDFVDTIYGNNAKGLYDIDGCYFFLEPYNSSAEKILNLYKEFTSDTSDLITKSIYKTTILASSSKYYWTTSIKQSEWIVNIIYGPLINPNKQHAPSFLICELKKTVPIPGRTCLKLFFSRKLSYQFNFESSISKQKFQHNLSDFSIDSSIDLGTAFSEYVRQFKKYEDYWKYVSTLCYPQYKSYVLDLKTPKSPVEYVYETRVFNTKCDVLPETCKELGISVDKCPTQLLNLTSGYSILSTMVALPWLDIAGIENRLYFRDMLYDCNINTGWYQTSEYTSEFRRYTCSAGGCKYSVESTVDCSDFDGSVIKIKCTSQKEGVKIVGYFKSKNNYYCAGGEYFSYTYDPSNKCSQKLDACVVYKEEEGDTFTCGLRYSCVDGKIYSCDTDCNPVSSISCNPSPCKCNEGWRLVKDCTKLKGKTFTRTESCTCTNPDGSTVDGTQTCTYVYTGGCAGSSCEYEKVSCEECQCSSNNNGNQPTPSNPLTPT